MASINGNAIATKTLFLNRGLRQFDNRADRSQRRSERPEWRVVRATSGATPVVTIRLEPVQVMPEVSENRDAAAASDNLCLAR